MCVDPSTFSFDQAYDDNDSGSDAYEQPTKALVVALAAGFAFEAAGTC
jgi:hypothetical protein